MSVSRPTCVVVLAAGEGTRMKSTRPKPLHHLCGRPMVLYVLDAAVQEDVRATVVVVGHGATWVEKSLTERARADVRLNFVEQSEQLGTGHAVSVARAGWRYPLSATNSARATATSSSCRATLLYCVRAPSRASSTYTVRAKR